MRNLSLNCLVYLFVLSFAVLSFSLIAGAEEDKHKDDIVTGNIICLIPNQAEGTVKPVIASGPCNGLGPHAHVVLDTRGKEGNVYAVTGSADAIERLEKTSSRKNVDVKGKIVVVISGLEGTQDPSAPFNSMSVKRQLAAERGAIALIELYRLSFPWRFFQNYFGKERLEPVMQKESDVSKDLVYAWLKEDSGAAAAALAEKEA